MIQTLVATLMWALVASLLIFRRKRTDRSVTYAALTIAIAMTLNVDGIYTCLLYKSPSPRDRTRSSMTSSA